MVKKKLWNSKAGLKNSSFVAPFFFRVQRTAMSCSCRGGGRHIVLWLSSSPLLLYSSCSECLSYSIHMSSKILASAGRCVGRRNLDPLCVELMSTQHLLRKINIALSDKDNSRRSQNVSFDESSPRPSLKRNRWWVSYFFYSRIRPLKKSFPPSLNRRHCTVTICLINFTLHEPVFSQAA